MTRNPSSSRLAPFSEALDTRKLHRSCSNHGCLNPTSIPSGFTLLLLLIVHKSAVTSCDQFSELPRIAVPPIQRFYVPLNTKIQTFLSLCKFY